MIGHLFGVIGCALSLSVSIVGATKNAYPSISLDNDNATYVSEIHEYRNFSFNSSYLDSANMRIRFYYDYDYNTQEFIYSDTLEYTYPITLDTPSNIDDSDTILKNYITINTAITSNGFGGNHDVCFWFIAQEGWVYRILTYNPDTFANLGYLEYFDTSTIGQYSLLNSSDYSGFSSSKTFDYSNFSHSTQYSRSFYSYFDRQSYGCASRLFYVSNFTSIHYSALSLDFRIDFTLFALPNTYASGYSQGYSNGSTEGFTNGYSEGKEIGYSEGYTNGFNDGTPMQISFLGLFGAIADTPVFIIRNLFSFEIFGINVLAVFMSLLTALLVLHFVRKLL